MRIALVQHDIVWEDRDATLERLEPQVAVAAATGARLVSLTEMFATGFSMRTNVTAEDPDGPTAVWMVEQARHHDVWLAGSRAELTPGDDRPTNCLLLVSPQGEITRYPKIHPFSYAGEDDHFAPGGKTVTVEVEGVRLSLFVCYDLRFANVFWDLAEETDAYLVVANWPGSRRDHWTRLLDARAIENQAYVLAVNRVGSGGELTYTGDSRVVDPGGQVLASAAHAETLLVADIDPAEVTRTRDSFPFLRDRTPR
jgi:predicted amidohydrolase